MTDSQNDEDVPKVLIGQKRRGPGRRQSQEAMERDAQALRLHAMRYSLSQVAQALDYRDASDVARALRRARERILKPAVMEHVAVQLARLDFVTAALVEIKQRKHVVTSGGKIVLDEHGNELQDSGPELRALAQIQSCSESTRRLLGLDAAVKIQVELDDDPVNKNIAALVAELESRNRATEQAAKRGEL
jgi:predicted transcriptional regulator